MLQPEGFQGHLMNMPRQSRQYVLELGVQLEEQQEEIKRLTDLRRTCQCSEEDQCMFARERDEARAELSKHVGELDECRRLLRAIVAERTGETHAGLVRVVIDNWPELVEYANQCVGE